MTLTTGDRVLSTLDHDRQGVITGLAHTTEHDTQFYLVLWDGETEPHLTRRVMPVPPVDEAPSPPVTDSTPDG